MRKRTISIVTAIIATTLMVLVLSGCPPAPLIPQEYLEQLYIMALEDARTAEADEVSTHLTPIVPTNDSLYWEGEGEDSRVLVVAWTDWAGYYDLLDDDYTTGSTRYTWVTAVPEVEAFCEREQLDRIEVTLRLEQLLGLPPFNEKTIFVEFWVHPHDLFRPTPDNEITDTTAGLTFPEDADPDYVAWFEGLRSESYSVSTNGHPWTRLGYTYDWANPHAPYGLSEFVIKPNSDVIVHTVTPTADYCDCQKTAFTSEDVVQE